MDATLQQLTAELQAVKEERDYYKSQLETLKKGDMEDHSSRVRKVLADWKKRMEDEISYSKALESTFV